MTRCGSCGLALQYHDGECEHCFYGVRRGSPISEVLFGDNRGGKAFELGKQSGADGERKSIVDWLREEAPAPYNIADADLIIGFLADAIKRGEHMNGG